METIRITQVDPTEAVALELIRDLSAELAGRYPDSHGGDGAGAFKPADVQVARATFIIAWRGIYLLALRNIFHVKDKTDWVGVVVSQQ